jgi:hypothetical protein
VSADIAVRRVLRELCTTTRGVILCSGGIVFGSNSIIALFVQGLEMVPCSPR